MGQVTACSTFIMVFLNGSRETVIIRLNPSQTTAGLLKGTKKIRQICSLPFVVILKKTLHFTLENTLQAGISCRRSVFLGNNYVSHIDY